MAKGKSNDKSVAHKIIFPLNKLTQDRNPRIISDIKPSKRITGSIFGKDLSPAAFSQISELGGSAKIDTVDRIQIVRSCRALERNARRVSEKIAPGEKFYWEKGGLGVMSRAVQRGTEKCGYKAQST